MISAPALLWQILFEGAYWKWNLHAHVQK